MLSEVAEVNPSTPPSVRQHAVGATVPFLAMSALSENGGAHYDETRPLGEVLKGYTYFERGDVLLAKITPCFENGKAAHVLDLPYDFGFGSTEFHILRPGTDIDGRYLFHAVWNRGFRALGSQNMTGTAGQKRLPADFLCRCRIPVPSVFEQRRTTAMLDKADAIRRKRRESIKLLDDFLRSAFLEMFGDPVRNPKGWPVGRLGDLAVIRRGASPRPIEQYLGGTIPWIKIGDATQSADLYVARTAEYVTGAGAKRSVYLEPGSIIVANSGVSLGFARILSIAGCIHDGWLSVEKLPDMVSRMYFVSFINQMTDHLRKSAPKGTQPNLNIGILSAQAMPLPPLALQNRYEVLLLKHARLAASFRSAGATTQHLFDSLAQQAFSGELSGDE